MQTIHEFIEKYGLTMEVKPAAGNPYMEDDDWAKTARHYSCAIIAGNGDWLQGSGHGTMHVPFSCGSAIKEPPALADVLSCLASDAAAVENAEDFESWAGELGFDADSRKAEAMYDTCVEQAEELKELLGEDAYAELLWETEQL